MLVWAYILLIAHPIDPYQHERLKRLRKILLPAMVILLICAPALSIVQENLEWIQSLVEQKFEGEQEGDLARWSYATGTLEIVLRYPLGVGYSGFYDAMTVTDTYRFGKATQEESASEANPHSSFLWYASAGGVLGGGIAVILFIELLNSMRLGLTSALGRPGMVLFILAMISFIAIGLIVPYLFNSIILIVPAGIAAGLGLRRSELAGVSQMNAKGPEVPHFQY